MHSSDLWRELRAEFTSLTNEEKAILKERAPISSLLAYCNLEKHPTVLTEQGEFASLLGETPTCGYWELNEGPTDDFRARFEVAATRAGIALSSPDDTKPLDHWFHRLFLDLLESDSSHLFVAKKDEGGMILHVCEASATYCARLEKQALETENNTALKKGTPDTQMNGTAAPLASQGTKPTTPKPFFGPMEAIPKTEDANSEPFGLLVPGTEEERRAKEELEAIWKAEEADPELKRKRQRRDADLQAVYNRFLGRRPSREELIQAARLYAESHLSEASSPKERWNISGRIWEYLEIPKHPDCKHLYFHTFHAAVWTEGNPSLEERAEEVAQGAANRYAAETLEDARGVSADPPFKQSSDFGHLPNADKDWHPAVHEIAEAAMADIGLWLDLEERFRKLHQEELRYKQDGGLHALWSPEGFGDGSHWYWGGCSAKEQKLFRWLAERASIQFGHVEDPTAVDFWLDRLKAESPDFESGRIQFLCRASADYCFRCGSRQLTRERAHGEQPDSKPEEEPSRHSSDARTFTSGRKAPTVRDVPARTADASHAKRIARTVATLIEQLRNVRPGMYEEKDYQERKAQHADFLVFTIGEAHPDLKQKIIYDQFSRQQILLAQQLAAVHHGVTLSTIKTYWKKHKPAEFRRGPVQEHRDSKRRMRSKK